MTTGYASRILFLIIQVDIERVIEIITELQSGIWAKERRSDSRYLRSSGVNAGQLGHDWPPRPAHSRAEIVNCYSKPRGCTICEEQGFEEQGNRDSILRHLL